MKKQKKFLVVFSVLLAIVIFCTSSIYAQNEERISSEPPRAGALVMSDSSELADQLVKAISKPNIEPFISTSIFEGVDAQAAILSTALQEFPRSGNQYIVLSTGPASNIPGVATTFSSVDMTGIHIPGGSPDGYDAYDVATLTLKLDLSDLAGDPPPRLVFRYKFCSEEPPTFWGSQYQDFFTAILRDETGQPIENIARLPNGTAFTIDNARPYMNQVQGGSSDPLPPYPFPNDVVFNACTGIHTTNFDLTDWVGQEIDLEYQIGDVNDAILDSAVFIDGLEIASGPLPDFSMTRVEFNQAVQSFEPNTDVAADQLVAGKQTVVRVYVKGEGNAIDPQRVSAALHIFKNGYPISGSPFEPSPRRITPVLNPSRTARDDNNRPTQTLQFYLPSSAIAEVGQYEYFVMVDPDNEVDEYDVLNNRFPLVGFNSFTLNNRPEIFILGYRINTVDGDGNPVNTWDDTDETRYGTGRTLTRSMFPAPNVQFWRVGDGRLEWDLDGTNPEGDLTTNAGRIALLNHLVGLMEGVNDWSQNSYDTVVGMLPRATNIGARGYAWVGRPGTVARTLEPDTLPHEIGHNWLPWGTFSEQSPNDVNHECTTSGNDGFDVLLRELRVNRQSLMCGGQTNRWVTPTSYGAFFNTNQLTATVSSMAQIQSETQALRIRGIIDEEGNLTLDPIYTFQTQDITPDDPLGNYVVELQYWDQSILSEVRFQLAKMIEDEVDLMNGGMFSLAIPRPGDLRFIVIKSLNPIKVLETVTVSDHPPSVTILSPVGGEKVDGQYEISWDGSDPDNDPLLYNVLYSHDGNHWGLLANNLTESSYMWDTSQYPGGSNAVIRIVATDGVNTDSAISDPFHVTPKPPEALIVSPQDGSEFPFGAMVVFVGIADDPEEGELIGDQMEWSSSLDGLLGTGENYATTDLSIGNHTITLTAMDSDGQTDTATILLDVFDTTLNAPTGLVATPGNNKVHLEWDSSTQPFLEGYKVYWGTSSGIYGDDIDVGNITNYTLDNLINGTTYYIAITAYNFADEESGFSNEVQVTPNPIPPSITSDDSTTFTVGEMKTFTVIALGDPIPTLSYNSSLPDGVTFTDNDDGTASLAGIPEAGSGGVYEFNIWASNNVDPDATQGFTLTVEEEIIEEDFQIFLPLILK